MSFQIGNRIGFKIDAQWYRPDEDCSFGVVNDVTAKGLIIVTWDDSCGNRESEILDPSKLMLESDIQAAQSMLERNFNNYKKEIEAKVDDATKALEEAIKLAKKAGCSVSDVVYKSVISNALYRAGWSGSSFAC